MASALVELRARQLAARQSLALSYGACYCLRMTRAEYQALMTQAQTDLAFALAQGDATAEDDAAARIAALRDLAAASAWSQDDAAA
jgi:hypothetical protein